MMKIREYRPEDREIIAGIAMRAWGEIYKMYRKLYGEELYRAVYPDGLEGKGNQVRRTCDEHPDNILICMEGERIVGFVTFILYRGRNTGEIGNNAVDPEAGVKGAGQLMYKTVLDIFRREGLKFAEVHTGLDYAHAPARRAYERAGFDIQEHEVTYYKYL